MVHKFIVFEGIDASGKTTLAKTVAERVNGVYYKCPPGVLQPIRRAVDESSPLARFYFYLAGNCMASEEIKELIKKSPVFCDGYVYSTIVNHSVLLGRDLTFPGGLLLPDHIIHTTASFRVIERRLSERPERSKYEQLPHLRKVALKFDELFYGLSAIRVDTSEQSLEESIEQILKGTYLSSSKPYKCPS